MNADVIVVGGGLVGATLAVALGRHGLTSVIVDQAELSETATAEYDGRVSAVASASARMLGAIGLGGVIEAHGQPIDEIRATDGLSRLHVHFDAAAAASGPLGWMVENRFLRRALLDAVAASPEVVLLAPAATAAVTRSATGVAVTLEDGRSITAPVMVAADGRGSPLRVAAGIRLAEWHYDAVSLVTTIAHERAHGGVAFEIFLPTGPLAILPMRPEPARHLSAIVWTVPGGDADGWAGLHPAALARELAARMDGFLGALAIASPVTRYPLRLQHADAFVADRLALVGDAGHVIHPIAGQGLNLGLRDVAALTEVLVDASRLGLDLGDAQVLARYQRWRRADVLAVSAATDGLARLFGLGGRLPAAVRRLGLAAVDRMPRVKGFFMAEARGEGGDLPALLRGGLA